MHRALLFVALSACGSGPSSKGDETKGDPCKGLLAHRLAMLDEELGPEPKAETLVGWLSPLGECSPPVPGGRWALALTDLAVEREDVYDDEDQERSTPIGSAVQLDAGAKLVFVTDKKKIIEGPGDLGQVNQFIGPDGHMFMPAYPYEPREMSLLVDTDWSGDGRPEAIVVGNGHVSAFELKGDRIVPFELPFETVTHVDDIDADGRRDALDESFFAVHLAGDANWTYGVKLVAHARPDGGFSTDDAATRTFYRKACKGRGRSPWRPGSPDDDPIFNASCARLFGVSASTILAGFDAEPEPEDTFFERSFLEDLVGREVPIVMQRDDGRHVARDVTVKASSNEPVYQGYRFDAAQAVDGDLGTSWQPKKTGPAWIELSFAKPETITALEIGNGFQRVDALGDLFLMNRRATSLKVEADGKSQVVTLDPEAREYQLVPLTPVTTQTLRITIMASADGTKWKNVALSEVRALIGP